MNATKTIEEIAQLADVSRSTVSRVLNEHPSVRPHVRERVLQVIQEQGYAPDAAARSLARRRSNIIGLVIPRSVAETFSDPFFGPVVHKLTEACMHHNYFLMLAMVTSDIEHDFYRQIVRSRHFDGVIMLSSDIDDPILPLMMKDNIPLVLFGGHPYLTQLSWVDVNQREGARLAVQHLVGLGHRRIAHITGLITMAAAQDRRDGYKQAVSEAGLVLRPDYIVEGDWSQRSGYLATNILLQRPNPPTAIFIGNDSMCMGAIQAINEAGLKIPQDISLVGFDDLPTFAQYTSPRLTTIRQPIGDLAHQCVKLLLDQLAQDMPTPRHTIISPELVIRDSTAVAHT
ncbi:MAG: LacI family DNA-binding transcriptional regulator [Herpetosiphon sp.]|nr:LacI family DNA-binding transcriptional regulator [Herpetosiphon sp.]